MLRVAVFGAGGVGGYFGGRIAALPNVDVTFIARGRHLDAMLADGLTVTTGAESFTVAPCKATDKAESVGVVDVVLVCVKAWQVQEVAQVIKASGLLGARSVVAPLQNGMSSVRHLQQALGEEHVCGGLCKIFGYIEAPGRVICPSGAQSVEFGCIGGASPSAEHEHMVALRGAFEAAGVAVTLHQDVLPAMWQKFIFICTLSSIGAICRVTWGEVRSTPEAWDVCCQCVREAVAVAEAHKVALGEAFVESVLQLLAEGISDEVTASMQRDVMDGKPSELEAQVGAMVRMAKEAAVATPVFSILYAGLLPLERRARGTSLSAAVAG